MKNIYRQVRKMYGCSLIFFFLVYTTAGQNSVRIKTLQAGDKLPDIEFDHVINYPQQKIRLAELRGKLVILDFWHTGCIGCIKSFPKLDSLQKEFGNKIQIILVNEESEDSTKHFFARRKKIIIPDLPFATSAKKVKELFPPTASYPFTIWVNGAGVVSFITEGYNTSSKKIKSFLDGNEIALEENKKAESVNLFSKQWNDQMEYYSSLSRCKRKMQLEGPPKRPGYKSITYGCRSLIQLYQTAYTKLSGDQYIFFRPGRTIIECTDSCKYFPPEDADERHRWLEQYAYNYQLFLPEKKQPEMYEIMRADLERGSNLKASVEQRKIKCLVLIRTSEKDKLKTKGGVPLSNFYQANLKSTDISYTRQLNNISYSTFSDLFAPIAESSFNLPFEDSTNYTGNIDIQFNGDALDSGNIDLLQKELKKYDLSLVIKECLITVLVLKETTK